MLPFLFFTVGLGLLSAGLITVGLKAIRTKTAHATKLGRLIADENGKIHGTPAVIKGWTLLLGGIVLGVMPIVVIAGAIYSMFVGPR